MLRSPRERVIQAVIYEALGLAILTPAYGFAMGLPLDNSLVTMALISGIVIVWSPGAFSRIRRRGRSARSMRCFMRRPSRPLPCRSSRS